MSGLDDILDDELNEMLEPTLQNIIDSKELQWIFVGGKGGVGKTTISSSLAVRLSKARESVLIISTDPAHNLSDAFSQKFSKSPTLINGFNNLYAMEIDPNVDTDEMFGDYVQNNSSIKNLMKEFTTSMPGMDEISSFMEIMKQVKSLKFSTVVFDTAPTGHTLRLLSLPNMMDGGLGKIFKMQNIGNLMGQFSSFLPQGMDSEKVEEQMGNTKELFEQVSKVFKDPKKCTFVCVCIPEFLSVYETERLVQELIKNGIDTHNIVVNQILFQSSCSTCQMCQARMKIQQKYLNQIFDIYSDFHIVQMPLLGEEVRGVPALEKFSENLLLNYPEKYKKEQEDKK